MRGVKKKQKGGKSHLIMPKQKHSVHTNPCGSGKKGKSSETQPPPIGRPTLTQCLELQHKLNAGGGEEDTGRKPVRVGGSGKSKRKEECGREGDEV